MTQVYTIQYSLNQMFDKTQTATNISRISMAVSEQHVTYKITIHCQFVDAVCYEATKDQLVIEEWKYNKEVIRLLIAFFVS